MDWYYKELGLEIGPIPAERFLELALEQKIGPETPVRKGLTGRWVPACKIRGLFVGSKTRPALVPKNKASSAPGLISTNINFSVLAQFLEDDEGG
jgi:hypothetical protein